MEVGDLKKAISIGIIEKGCKEIPKNILKNSKVFAFSLQKQPSDDYIPEKLSDARLKLIYSKGRGSLALQINNKTIPRDSRFVISDERLKSGDWVPIV